MLSQPNNSSPLSLLDESSSRGEQTRLEIIQAAARLFIHQGYHGTSMRQVAHAAGVSLSGIYNHFPSKEALFVAILLERHPVKEIVPALNASQGETVEALVRDAARLLVETLGKRMDFLNLIFIELVEFNACHLPDMFSKVVPQVMPFIERVYQANGSMQAVSPILLLRSFMGLFISYVITGIMIGEQTSSEAGEKTLERFIDIYLHGICDLPNVSLRKKL
jgi:AcrR family transcriptional regulator